MYACISCGYNPSVIVMDLHKKGVFNMPGELDKMLFHKMYSLNAFTIAPFSKLLSSQQYYNYNGVKILDFFLFDFFFGAACSHDLFFSCWHQHHIYLFLPVSDIESPPDNYDGHVDIEQFWDAVTREMLSRGLIPCKSWTKSNQLLRITMFCLCLRLCEIIF